MRNAVVLAGLIMLGAIICGTAWKPLRAEQNKADSGPRELAEAAVEKLRQDDVPGMMEVLSDQLVYTMPSFEITCDMCTSQREGMMGRHGKPLGELALVRTERVGGSFVRFTYIERFENHAMVWRLGYYRTREGWRLNEFEWDDKVKQLYTAAE